MSGKTWKAKYYSISATSRFGTPTEAVAHSLKKWRGLTPANLKRHGLHLRKYDVCNKDGEDVMIIDYGSCSLCQTYSTVNNCEFCPIRIHNNQNCHSEFRLFLKGDPKPMIRLLTQTLKKLTGERSPKGKK